MMRAFVAVCALWSALAVADDVLQTISPSVVKVPPDQDFATVLIAQSDRLPHGRVLNVKPTVGVITSTARTFINGGATTEFASQVLATTLADGRYAHLLARSSRVFYEGQSRLPASADPRLNDVTHASWPDVETFIGNTDFVVTPIASQAVVEPTIIIEPSVVAVKVTAVQQETPSVAPKRVPGENLATFTVGFDTSGVPDAEAAESDQESGREARKLSGFPLDIGSSLARVTYYGFADFTTTVGDTIIVFSPSTAQPEPGHVTSIVGEPTLSEAPRVTQTSQTRVKTQEIFIEPTPTVTQETVATVAPETFSEETPLETLIQVTPSQETPAPEIPAVEEIPIEEEITPEVEEEEVVEEQTEATTEGLEMPEENEISPPVDAPKLSTPTNEDIAKIFESLAKQSSSVQETLVSGGATTIFFEDEPLAPSEVEAPRTITSGDCQNAEVLTYLTTFFLTDTTSVKTNEVTQCHTALNTGMTEHPPEMEASETTLGTTEAEEETTTTFIEETTEALEITTETTDAITETTEAKEVEVKKEPEGEKKNEPEVEKEKEEPKVEKIKEIQIEKPKAPELVIKKEPEKVLKIEPTSVVKNEPSTVANRLQPDTESTTEGLSEIELIYKTLYTTYTYLTTFFHESTSSVSTRKEVVTNVVTTTVTPAMLEDLADIVNSMVAEKQEGIGVGRPTVAYTPTPSLEDVARAIGGGSTDGVRTLYTTYTYFTTIFVDGETDISSRTEVYTNYVTQPGQILQTSEILEIQPTATDSYSTMTRSTDDNVTFMVTDVRSSSSNGESEVINNQLEDQVSSESNTDEILPSATLLLQTSYTTFTYFTTMYMGSTSSVVSRLETITNVVTETVDRITPEATLPITYFTTFTYWTTLFRDGTTTTTSREETISNVVSESPEPSSATIETIVATTPTTYFTTYTYFTTSYVGDETVLNSRFETVTNVVPAPTVETVTPEMTTETTHSIAAVSAAPTARAIDVKSVKANAIEDGRRNVISRNHGKIVDADGITTILFTTEGVGTLIDGLYAQIIESTSTVVVDESRTAQPTTALPTGLVRLIDGTIVTNHTTTLYQSRVIGTVIDGRYAQIIESTSSYLIDRTMAPATTTATPTIEPTPEVTETTETEEPPEVADTTRGGGLFATRKRTFTPVIRPFSSRARPTFNPIKRKGATTSALTVTRTDLTPTIRATPASKVESKGRFTSRRSSSPSSYLAPSSSSSSYGGGSSSRRFSRPRPIAPSSTRRPQAPQSTTAELPQETVTTRAPSLRGLSRRPSLAARRTTTAPIITTTTPRARTPLRASFGNRTRIGSLFPPRALFRPQQTEIDQRLDEDENSESETESGRQKRQAVEYGTRARYIGRRTTTTTTTTPQPYFRGSYRRTQPTSRRSQTSYRPQQQRQRVTSRRPPTRTRGRITEAPEYNLPPPDGTLTVTHLVPVSTSVPNIINGNTQYRQIVTQSASVEIVSPGGYSVSTGGDGLATTLLSKLTSLTPSGATEVIQLHLKESPTTTIIFTPTTIRGRRTSFSHIVPTTAYTVERMVSTVNIDANAPLANILLSQLLLGNLNFGNLGVAQTPFANFGNLAVAPTATQPATHYHTRSTTFVTTITNELSTVLPLTFHGKQVLTTIYDRTLSTVTATEYITDTVVETPPSQVIQQQPALNSLLLPLLLQQQASVQDTDAKLQAIEEDPKPSTSVVTLYVSGRTPGDFSTLLSTVVERPKRSAPTEILATVPPFLA
ncbi:mucin-2 isoform X1 [Lutzomyia longipalpis]|uniref:mucin-2 isoform X1 n=1 Tax=Lutzomyia longipalpis TaxID=7200 RepID=UPI0024843CE6|nr:mucin-2 isoform X1 [Lutzomyia longipalpis]